MTLCKGINGKPCPVDKQAKHGSLCRVCHFESKPAGLKSADVVHTPAPARTRFVRTVDNVGSPALGGFTRALDESAESMETETGDVTIDNAEDGDQADDDEDTPVLVIVNELLFYLANMLGTMEQAMLLKVCESHFQLEEILQAKKEIFRHNVNEHIRFTKRIGDKKLETNLRDIIDVFRKNDPVFLPVFAAADLSRIPPLDFRGANMAALMCEVSQLRREMNSVRNIEASSRTLVAEFGNLKKQIREREQKSQKERMPDEKTVVSLGIQTEEFIATDPGEEEPLHGQDAATPDSAQSDVRMTSPPRVSRRQSTQDSPSAQNYESEEHHRNKPTGDNGSVRETEESRSTPTWSDRVASNLRPTVETPSDGFTTVGKDGRPVRTKSITSDSFLMPQRSRKSEIVYVSNISTTVGCEALQAEIRKRCGVSSRCRKLNVKMADPDFNSFQVFVSPEDADAVLNKDNWPRFVRVRVWERRGRPRSDDGGRMDLPKPIPTMIGNRGPVDELASRRTRLFTPDRWWDCEEYENR